MKTRQRVKRITADELSHKKCPTLEDIMAVVNGGKYEKFFLNEVKKFKDGSREPFTIKGAKVYADLVNILYACARLTEGDVEDIVETMDGIADECI